MHLADTIFEEYQMRCNTSLQKVLKVAENSTEAKRRNFLQHFISACDKWIQRIDLLKADLNQQKRQCSIGTKYLSVTQFSSYISRLLNHN